jgi:hypothetical protein
MPWPPPQDPAGEGCQARVVDFFGSLPGELSEELNRQRLRAHRAGVSGCESPEGRAQAVPFGNWLVCMPRQKRRHAEWRKLARGPKIAGWCPHPTGRAVPLSHARTVAHESGLWPRPARAWPCVDNPGTPGPRRLNADPFPNPQGGPPQARFHPRSGCQPAQTGTRNRNLSGGWLGPPGRCGR